MLQKTHIQQFTQALNVATPIVCGPMYPGSNPELIAAVSEAGGIGVVQPVTLTYVYDYDFAAGLDKIKSLTDKPFGVNFTLMPNKRYEKQMKHWVDISIAAGVKFFLTSLGDPSWIVKKAKENGITVYHDVSTRKFAKKAIDAGVDGLNCVNNRAGGQTGSISPEQMMDELQNLNIPLVCAGGVGDEQDFAKVLRMGYAAVQLGTRFLATTECNIQKDYKEAIIKAQEKDIVWTNKLAGVNSSVINTPTIQKNGLRTGAILSFLLRKKATKSIARLFLLVQSLQRFKQVTHQKGYGQYWQAGKGVDNIRRIEPAKYIVQRFHETYEKLMLGY